MVDTLTFSIRKTRYQISSTQCQLHLYSTNVVAMNNFLHSLFYISRYSRKNKCNQIKNRIDSQLSEYIPIAVSVYCCLQLLLPLLTKPIDILTISANCCHMQQPISPSLLSNYCIRLQLMSTKPVDILYSYSTADK